MTTLQTTPERFVSKPLFLWLLVCCGMIFAMVVIGAITRLTESGLSMVEWRAMIDMLPPLSDHAWISEFEKYRQTPEYLVKNKGMDLDAFKNIYFWEWFHRLWGRLIGLVYALPLVYFWVRGKIPQHLKSRFIFLLFLGGLQGFFGWYMVKSGLINEPRVSHYRLALHLITAFVLFSALWVQALSLWPALHHKLKHHTIIDAKQFRFHAIITCFVVFLTILWGAFVAGLDAGLIYNQFPLIGDRFVPSEFLFMKPWWINFLNNHATVQWMHRVLGIISFFTVLSLGLRLIITRQWVFKKIGHCLTGMITVQFILGIVTLLSKVALHPAVSHQAGALLTTMFLVTLLHFLWRKAD
jgi:cytochrome c oxidase assembly protein subunit 15